MNKILRTIVLLFILINEGTVCSQVTIGWVARYNVGYSGNAGLGITIDDSGYVYVTGNSHGGPTRQDMVVIKYSPTGANLWTRRDSNAENIYRSGFDVKVDNLYNVIVAGIGIYKYDLNGNLIWKNSQDVRFEAIAFDTNYNIFVTGGASAMFVTRKYNSDGNILWTQSFQYLNTNESRDITMDRKGNVIITGLASQNQSLYDYMTIKYSNIGTEIWQRRYNGGNYDDPYAITSDEFNNVYVTGWSTNSNSDILTIKYSPAGDTIWKTVYNGGGGDIGYDIEVDSLGYVYVGGVTNSSSYITLKYDPYGNLIWSRVQPSHLIPWFPKLKLDKNRNVYMSFVSFRPGLYENYAVVKYNNDGVQQWIAEYNNGGSSTNIIRAMDVDLNGNVYVTGESGGSMATVKFVQTPTEIIQPSSLIPELIKLNQNYPNPFNPTTNIEFGISKLGFVSLKVYDILGNEVATLVNEQKNAGSYNAKFDGGILASGIYYYKLSTENFSQTKKMLLIK